MTQKAWLIGATVAAATLAVLLCVISLVALQLRAEVDGLAAELRDAETQLQDAADFELSLALENAELSREVQERRKGAVLSGVNSIALMRSIQEMGFRVGDDIPHGPRGDNTTTDFRRGQTVITMDSVGNAVVRVDVAMPDDTPNADLLAIVRVTSPNFATGLSTEDFLAWARDVPPGMPQEYRHSMRCISLEKLPDLGVVRMVITGG